MTEKGTMPYQWVMRTLVMDKLDSMVINNGLQCIGIT